MLVGRDGELARCRAALTAAAAGQAAFIGLVGEPGIGKTALLNAVGALDERFRELRVTGVPAEASIAFAGLETLVRPVSGWMEALPEQQQTVLRSVLGSDDAVAPGLLSVVGGILALLAAVTADQPVLLVVDDAQWLDEPSKHALGAVARRLGGERVVMLVASREPEPHFDPSQALRLAALDARESAELLLGRRPDLDASVADQLHRWSAGNPLCLVEWVDHLSSTEVEGRSGLGAIQPVPDRIRAVHESLIEALAQPTQELLTILACAGRGDVPTVLAAAAAVGITDSEAQLDQLVSTELVVVHEQTVRLRHPLLRPSILDRAGMSGVRRAHESLAAALVSTDPDRALWHRAAAAIGHDEGLAVELTSFAERLAARAQPDSARRALESAAALTADADRRAERLVQALELSLVSGIGPTTAALLDRVRSDASLSAAHDLRVRVVEARLAVRRGQRARAAAALLDVVVALPPDARPDIVALTVAAAVEVGDLDTARAGLELLGPDEFSDVAGPAVAYLADPTAQALPVDLRGAFVTWPSERGPAMLSVLRQTAMQAGELVAARSISVESLELAHASGDVVGLADANLSLAFCDHALGNWNSAAARAFEVTQLVDESHETSAVAEALLILADIEASRGNEVCRATCARVRALAEQLSDPIFAILADRREALLDVPGPDPSAALSLLRSAQLRFERAELRHPFYSPVGDLVEVLVRLGRRDEAAELAPSFLELVGEAAPGPPRARALRIRGLLAPEGRYDAHFDASVAADEGAGQSFQAARTMLVQGERRRRDGRRVDARARLEPALDIFRGLEAGPWVRRAEGELAACGVAVTRPGRPAVTESLTNQELQIAALVAEGHRNSEIAAALYLSTKTVEFHLTRAYRKAGVSNRTQLAAAMSHAQVRSS